MAGRKYKKRRKRSGGGFILSLLTFAVVVGAIITSVTVFLKVADIEVSGTTRYEAADIIAASGIESGDNLFAINKFEVAEKILDEYPYIEQIKIRRRLPDTFTFEITERVPAAYIEGEGNRWLIDNNAYIVELLAKDAAVKVPKITGCEVVTPREGSYLILKNEDQLTALKEVLTSLRKTEMTDKTVRVDMGKLYDINIVMGDRFLIELGDSQELAAKIRMLNAVLSELGEYDKGTINVSAIKEARFRPDINIDLSEKPAVQENTAESESTEENAEDNTEENTEDNSGKEESGEATEENAEDGENEEE